MHSFRIVKTYNILEKISLDHVYAIGSALSAENANARSFLTRQRPRSRYRLEPLSPAYTTSRIDFYDQPPCNARYRYERKLVVVTKNVHNEGLRRRRRGRDEWRAIVVVDKVDTCSDRVWNSTGWNDVDHNVTIWHNFFLHDFNSCNIILSVARLSRNSNNAPV